MLKLNHLPLRFDFHALRHIAAILVIVGHSFELGARAHFGAVGDPMMMRFGTETIAGTGVMIFFAISGYLVTQSAQRSIDVLDFLWKRALRIVPAFWVVTVVSVLFWGPALTKLPLTEYFSHRDTHNFMMGLFMKLSQFLPGVFTTNPLTQGFNGSLWTLPLETKCYLMIAALCMFGVRWLPWTLVGALVAMAFTIWFVFFMRAVMVPFFRVEGIPFAKLVTPFLLGAALAVFKFEKHLHPRLAVLLVLLISFCAFLSPKFQRVAWLPFSIAIAYATLSVGTFFDRGVTAGESHSDISYGLYLWAFPIQQTLLATFPAISTSALLLVTLLLVIPIAWASWNWVEKPMLREKKWYANNLRPRLNLRASTLN